MLRVYFNRTYASHAHVLAMLRANPDQEQVRLLASHVDPDSPVLAASDEAYAEPDPSLSESDYVAWSLDFTARHEVDVFFPRLHLAALAGAAERFARVGVSLAAPAAATVRLFDDKAATYAVAAELGLLVPPHRVVTDSRTLREAVRELAPDGTPLCLKPVTGVGGDGFRVLGTTQLTLAELLGPLDGSETLDRVCAALDGAALDGATALDGAALDGATALDGAPAQDRVVPRLLVAPVMPGPEVSVDTLADPHGRMVAAIGRVKSRRRRLIVDDAEARIATQALVRAHQLAYLSNTQFRYWQAPGDRAPRPYLLEVNPRMSGGLYQTRLAGVNLPWAAVRLATGRDAGLGPPSFGAAYTLLDTVVVLPAS